MQAVRLYGRLSGYGSHAQVTRGFSEALREAELLAGTVALDQDPGPDDDQPPGATATVGVFTGPLGYLPLLRRQGSHRDRYAMVAPNSSLVPPMLLRSLEAHCTEILAPSHWARGVLEEETSLPVRTVPHGVDGEFRAEEGLRAEARATYARGAFAVLHLATSERERKGTRALLEGWASAMETRLLPAEAQLRLVLDMEAASQILAWMADRAGTHPPLTNVSVAVRVDAAPRQLARIYGEHHVVCQPSRGEGFGLCGLEALACGVPIVATACTGHSEWFAPRLPGATRVEHGPNRPIDDLPGAVAPEVTADAIAVALHSAYKEWDELDRAAWAHASAVRSEWAWSKQLAPFVAHLKESTR